MIVISVKVRKKQLLWTAAGLAAVLAAVIWAAAGMRGAVATGGKAGALAETEDQRRAFLASCGWELAADPVEIRQVTIPDTFNEVYTAYNELQQKQGMDLSRYRGKTVKRWTYEITNYPDAGEERVYADLLVYQGRIIGGSVGTRTASGFMHGWIRTEEASSS